MRDSEEEYSIEYLLDLLIDVNKTYDDVKNEIVMNTVLKSDKNVVELIKEIDASFLEEDIMIEEIERDDVDGVLDYLYGTRLFHKHPHRISRIIDYIESHIESHIE